VLRIRDVYPGSEFFPSRIRIKEFKYFNPKKLFLSSRKYDPEFLPFPDPGAKKAPDPRSGSAKLPRRRQNLQYAIRILQGQSLSPFKSNLKTAVSNPKLNNGHGSNLTMAGHGANLTMVMVQT
jgi:hypothetical protein